MENFFLEAASSYVSVYVRMRVYVYMSLYIVFCFFITPRGTYWPVMISRYFDFLCVCFAT